MKFSKLIPIVFLFMASCSAPMTSVPTPTLMPEPTASQTLIPTPTEIPTQTPVPERFTKENLTNIPKSAEQIKNCPEIASPVDEEQFKKDIDQALYSVAGLQILNGWKGYTIEIPSPTGAVAADSESVVFRAPAVVDPAVCLRFKDNANNDAVLLGLPAVHAGNKFYFLVTPNNDDDGKWDTETKKSSVDGLLGKLPISVNKGAYFYTSVQTNKYLTGLNTPFLTSILSLPSQQETGEDLRTCIVSNEAQADIARLACDRLKYKVSIWGNIQ